METQQIQSSFKDCSKHSSSSAGKLLLTDLPFEILSLIPGYLRNIEEFKDASSSCRSLYLAFQTTSSNTILRLAAKSDRIFFQPCPHFLIAATIRQVSDWALRSESNTATLRSAFKDGVDGLFELCVKVAGITMDDIRRLYDSRFTTINPVIDMIDKCAGQQWYDTPNFWNGGVSDAFTVYSEPSRALFQIAIYGELFGTTMQARIESRLGFDLETRLEFIKYCIPDEACWLGLVGLGLERAGPYKDCVDRQDSTHTIDPHGDQVALW